MSPSLLQWGRDRAVAELNNSDVLFTWRYMLQWGRDRAVAELQFQRTMHSYLIELQWGRDRAVAELLVPGAILRNYFRFNGAATARSRNSGGPDWYYNIPLRFNGAATARSRN